MEVESGKNLKVHSIAFKMIGDIEKQFPVDSIKLSDGTKIWNLLRVIIFYYFQKKENTSIKRFDTSASKSNLLLHFIAENILPIKYPNKVDFCGFSGTESRKLWKGTYYDIYLDPLYEVLGNSFAVFEWPDEKGYRRRYDGKIYSRNYVPMHIPIFTKTFWYIALYKLLGKEHFKIDGNVALDGIIKFIANSYSRDEKKLRKHVHDSIEIFVCVKSLLRRLLERIEPKAVFIRCGYGRFHMALSQACRELNIPSVELQHGFINQYIPGYVKIAKSENRDCVPEYFLAYGERFADLVRKGNLFDQKKVVSIGSPYLENIKDSELQFDESVKQFKSKYSKNILITSDSLSHIADAVEKFAIELSKMLSIKNKNIGIIFKPHPFDKKNYQHFKKIENICVVDRYASTYDLFKISDIHSTVFSTSAIEALVFGVPNILIDVKGGYSENIKDIVDEKSSFTAIDVNQYIQKLDLIFLDYKRYSKNALQKSKSYFRPNALRNFREFIREHKIYPH